MTKLEQSIATFDKDPRLFKNPLRRISCVRKVGAGWVLVHPPTGIQDVLADSLSTLARGASSAAVPNVFDKNVNAVRLLWNWERDR